MNRRNDRVVGGDATAPYLVADLQGEVFAESQGSYELCREIAVGGMARIYLALHEGIDGLRRRVALKCVHAQLTQQPNFAKMFFEEAQIAALVDHASVCRLYDFGSMGQGYFLAMEYLVGEPLTRVISAMRDCRRADIRERAPLFAARIIANACEGLHAGHEVRGPRGELLEVVHRNVTPQNIFVLYDGTVRLLDFGAARCHERLRETSLGIHNGKLAYGAPEQAGGGRIDRRTDIWSAGVVLHELITQRPLFHGRYPAETIDRLLTAPIEPPSRYAPEAPSALDGVVGRMLCREPEGRYATAREVAANLEAVLSAQHDTVPAADVADLMTTLFRSREPEAPSSRRPTVRVSHLRGPAGSEPDLPVTVSIATTTLKYIDQQRPAGAHLGERTRRGRT